MNKLENALYIIVKNNIDNTNYKEFKTLYDAYKNIYDMNIEDISINNQEVLNELNTIKDTYTNSFNIRVFNENINLTINDTIDNRITDGYSASPFSDKKELNIDDYNNDIFKYKLKVLLEQDSNTLKDNKFEISGDEYTNETNITTETVQKFVNSFNTLIKKDDKSIYDILNCIFENNFRFQPDINFNELLIPCNVLNIINKPNKELDEKINLDELRNKYIELQDGVKSGIKDEDFVSFIHDRFTDLIDNDTYDTVKEKIQKDDKKIVDAFKQKPLTDKETIEQINFSEVKEFDTINKNMKDVLSEILNVKDVQNNIREEINNLLQENFNIELEPDQNGKFGIIINNTNVLSTLNLLRNKSLDYYLNIDNNQLEKYCKQLQITPIKLNNNDNIKTLGDGIFSNMTNALGKYLKSDLTFQIFLDNLQDYVLVLNDQDNLQEFFNNVCNSDVDKKEFTEKLCNLFKNYNEESSNYIKLYYTFIYYNKGSQNAKQEQNQG